MGKRVEYKTCPVPAMVDTTELVRTGISGWELLGLAAAFGNVDAGRDCIEPGAFAASLKERKLVVMHLNHTGDPCGKWVQLAEAEQGLLARGTIAKTTRGKDLRELVSTGITPALSIGYTVEKSYWGEREGKSCRILQVLDLMEISVVSAPMNAKATLGGATLPPQVIRDLLHVKGASAAVRAGRGTPMQVKNYLGAELRLLNRNGYLAAKEHEAKVARLVHLFGVEGAETAVDNDLPMTAIIAQEVLHLEWMLGRKP